MTERILGEPREGKSFCALPSLEREVDGIPGIWDGHNTEGMICVVNQDAFDVVIEPGHRVGEVVEAVLQTDVCQDCGQQDTRAWFRKAGDHMCDDCGAYLTKAPAPCLGCEAESEDQVVLNHLGCADCRPEARMKGKVRRGPAALFLAAAFLSFVDECG